MSNHDKLIDLINEALFTTPPFILSDRATSLLIKCKAQLEKDKEALEFYGNEVNYREIDTGELDEEFFEIIENSPIEDDDGDTARQALNGETQ